MLPWVGSLNITKIADIETQVYERVGKTPVIARGGWKGYEIPRFDIDSRCIYEKNPRDSYRAWQEPSRSPMKLGHWVYGGHHEIFMVNLLLAFDSELDRISFELGGSLAKFTYANFFRVFNVVENDLNKHSKKLMLSIKDDNYTHLLPEKLGQEKPILVYPSHPVTDHIIDRFLSLFEESAVQRIRSCLVAILPVRRHRSGSGLQVSGITLERLKKAVTVVHNRPVVYFDDGVISGRTFAEVKRLLRGIGYGYIYSIVLIDRQRLPSVHHMNNDKHVGYWRLDAPSMGTKSHCPLCHAIDKINAFKDSIVSISHRKRMDEWCDTWKELDPSTQWGNRGLRPIPLNLKKPNRKFCLRYNPNSKKYEGIGQAVDQEILLTNSVGLIAWVTELHTITSRDDFSITLMKKEPASFSAEVRIQLLASQMLLFSAEFDTNHKKKIALSLIDALWRVSKHDRHSALAVLSLVSCVEDLFPLLKKFLDSKSEPRWLMLKDRNIDFILIVALMLTTQGNDQIRELENIKNFDVVSRLLKPRQKSDLYYRLHREVWDALGRAHSSPLHHFVSYNNSYRVQSKEQLMNALASASQIKVISINIFQHWHWLRAGTYAHKNCKTINKNIEEKEKELGEQINTLAFPLDLDKNNEAKFTNAQAKGKNLLNEGKKLHAGLFAKLGINEVKNGEKFAFIEEIEKLNTEFEIDHKKISIKWSKLGENETISLFSAIKKEEIEEAFIVWDAEIREAVQDILSNARRADMEISNPWSTKGKGTMAHMWCRFTLNEFSVNIEMKNHSSLKNQEVQEVTKNSHSHYIIKEIGGSVSYPKSNDNLLLTIISLPYAHTLQT